MLKVAGSGLTRQNARQVYLFFGMVIVGGYLLLTSLSFRLFIRFASTTGDKTAEPPSQLDTEKQQPQGWLSRILTGPQYNPEGFHKQPHSSMLAASDSIYELQSLLFNLHWGWPGDSFNVSLKVDYSQLQLMTCTETKMII